MLYTHWGMCCLDVKLIAGMFQKCAGMGPEWKTVRKKTNIQFTESLKFPCTLFGLQGYCAKSRCI